MHEGHHLHHHPKAHKRLWWVLSLSVSYMVLEIIGGFLSGSLALFADAGHMAIDSLAVALGLFAAWVATHPPTAEKTYGYYRAEILAALINGAVLVAVSMGILFEAWKRFSDPRSIQGDLMFAIAMGGLVVNLISLYLFHGQDRSSLNLRGVWLHLLSDTLGSVSAVVASVFVWKMGWLGADPVISCLIGVFILVGAVQLLSESVNVLLEGVPKGLDVSVIKQQIEKVVGVVDVHDLHVWTVTSGVPALSAHVGVQADTDHGAVLKEITELLGRDYRIDHVTLQLDPPSYKHEALHF